MSSSHLSVSRPTETWSSRATCSNPQRLLVINNPPIPTTSRHMSIIASSFFDFSTVIEAIVPLA